MCVPEGFYHRYVVCLLLQTNLDNLKYYNVQMPDAGVNIARFSLWKQMFDGLQISSFQGKLGPNSLNVWVLVNFASMGVSSFTKALWMCCFEESSGAEKPPMSTIFKHPVLTNVNKKMFHVILVGILGGRSNSIGPLDLSFLKIPARPALSSSRGGFLVQKNKCGKGEFQI